MIGQVSNTSFSFSPPSRTSQKNNHNAGHAGGLVGGALAALLLGPRMVTRGEGNSRRVYDEPQCRWLASPPTR